MMRPLRHKSVRVAAVAVALLATCVCSAGAAGPAPSAAPVAPVPAAAATLPAGACPPQGTAPDTNPPSKTIPPHVPDPVPGVVAPQTGNVCALEATHAVKPQLNIQMAEQLAAIYVDPTDEYNPYPGLSAAAGGGGYTYAPRSRQPSCAQNVPYPDPNSQQIDSSLAIDSITVADLYFVQVIKSGDPHTPPRYLFGQAQPTKVSMLAFGSIPVTATLYLNQLVYPSGPRRGLYEPITATQYTAALAPDCDPSWAQEPLGVPDVPSALNTATGQVNMRIGDVAVDGQPVDVGTNCHTQTPLRLNMFGKPGSLTDPTAYFPLDGGPLIQKYNPVRTLPTPDNSAGYQIYPGSTDLIIPAFSGCRGADGQDLSRLLTAMVSTPLNTVPGGQKGYKPGNSLAVNQGLANITLTKTDANGNAYGGLDPANPAACGIDSSSHKTVCPLAPGAGYPKLPNS